MGEKLLLIGPNRRCEHTIIEQHLIPEPPELAALSPRTIALLENVLAALPPGDHAPTTQWPGLHADRPLAWLAASFIALALALQRHAGHRVSDCGFEADHTGEGVWCWFEYEHDVVGERAAELALRLLSALLVAGAAGDRWPTEEQAAEFESFRNWAGAHLLPRDTEAIVRAALRHDVPCVKLERDPYPGLEGDFRIRRNGLLLLGHARHRQIVDGTFCVTRCARLHPLVRDRAARRNLLASWQVPIVSHSSESIAVAGRSGDLHRILLAGAEPVLMLQGEHQRALDRVHPQTLVLARDLVRRFGTGLALIDIVARDISQPLASTSGGVADVDLAPELDRLPGIDSPALDQAAEAFVQWLFPTGSAARIPIVSITGTNGKTTTCRMVSRMLRTGGRHTGMVISGGVHLDDRFDATRDEVGPGAHHFLLERDDVEAAVFEEYFGRIARLGFAYHWCDVAVCTNVTNDHLGRIGIHTLDQMAALKRAVLERARRAVVLNADDDRCLAMSAHCTARRICLVSRNQQLERIAGTLGRRGARCIVETVSAKDWAVLYDGDRRIPLLPVADIPATFGGTAGFNISNALLAAAAAYFVGVQPQDIVGSLKEFHMSFESTPGRLNRFEGLPFQVVMDYAHNAAGFAELCAYIEQQPITGRRILMVGYTGDRQDDDIRTAISGLAGHFDHYVCRNYARIRQRAPHEVPALIEQALLDQGIPADRLDVEPDANRAVVHTLNMAREGDLVVLLVGESEFEEVWQLLRKRSSDGNSG